MVDVQKQSVWYIYILGRPTFFVNSMLTMNGELNHCLIDLSIEWFARLLDRVVGWLGG